LGEALGAAAPVDHLSFIDLVSRVVGGRQARRGTDRAVDVDHAAARTADQVVVVVADPVLMARRRPGRLDAPDQALFDQDAEDVVHRLAGDDADLSPYDPGDGVRRDVRSTRHRRQNGQALRRDLNAMLAQQALCIARHVRVIRVDLDVVKNSTWSNLGGADAYG
jgi:hypothetical protein